MQNTKHKIQNKKMQNKLQNKTQSGKPKKYVIQNTKYKIQNTRQKENKKAQNTIHNTKK